MTREELKAQYRTNKISAKEYFLALGEILKKEMSKSVQEEKNDILSVFDGKLPL